MADIMYYNYILKLNNKAFYKGQTQDLNKRLKDHEVGNVRTTKNKLPFQLVHVELTKNRFEARNLERFFKSGFGREIIHELAGWRNGRRAGLKNL